jgi:hypothetical protein
MTQVKFNIVFAMIEKGDMADAIDLLKTMKEDTTYM